jgi:amino acid transporter
MLWTGAIPVVTSLSTVSLYVAYIVPVVLGWRVRSEWAHNAVWNLGRFGRVVNTIAIVYTAIICVILVMPPNALAGQTFAGLCIALTLLYIFRARHYYKGPDWSKHRAEPT